MLAASTWKLCSIVRAVLRRSNREEHEEEGACVDDEEEQRNAEYPISS